MAYQLFYSPGACSMAAHIALEETGAPFTLQLVSVSKGEAAREPYLSINPKGRVPALSIDGEPSVLTELPAILVFLAQRHPEAGLIPLHSALAQARCEEWLAWLSGWVHAVGFGLLWRPGRFSDETAHHETLMEKGRRVIEVAYADIEKSFHDDRTWTLGSDFSLVDPFLLVLYRWGNRIGLPMREGYPRWTSVTDRMRERPSVLRVLEREQVAIDG